MDKRFVVSLLVLQVTGCSNPPWDSGTILTLKVDEPRNGTTVTVSTVTVSGRVFGSESATAKVSVNDKEVPVTDHKFSTTVTLNEGKNVITVVAANGAAKPSQILTVNYAPAT
jgi:hypothetical protein